MPTELFTEFGLVIITASVMALLMHTLRQPLIIGHILTGLLVGPLALNLMRSGEIFSLFGEIGVAFLLFSVGLSLNPRVLRDYGKVALVTGIGQVIFTTLAGLAIMLLLGFELIPSLYISIALTFSSTIIILKLISDKGDIEKLYTKISIGFLLVQDFIAVILLFVIPVITTETGSLAMLVGSFARAIGFSILIFLAARFLLARMHAGFERSTELLFLIAIAWGLGIAVLFREIGFSLETGALIAGVSLSLLPSRHEIISRLAPLRDFFIIIFFVVLGAQMALGNWHAILFPALILSLLVLIGNPLILISIMGFMGYRRKTSLQTGFTVAQISEFSLILVALGVTLGHVSKTELSMVTLVGLTTMFGSTYLILYSDWWYRLLGPYLKLFERRRPTEHDERQPQYQFVLIGSNRIGFDFIEMFKRSGKRFLVIDHDPEIIKGLRTDGIDCEFGDAGDVDFIESLGLRKAELVVSTVPDFEISALILKVSRDERKRRPMVMVVSHSIANALKLYEMGAAYVILPHFLGGKHASDIARRFVRTIANVSELRAEHIRYLKQRAERGHEHPVVERYR
jgi:Kef-type K+ transport system membrane component KefB/Trk K+ transport system NAD-binding subunit